MPWPIVQQQSILMYSSGRKYHELRGRFRGSTECLARAQPGHRIPAFEKMHRYKAWRLQRFSVSGHRPYRNGEYRDALATFKQCMNIDDKAPHAYSNMGIVYQKMNNLDEALRHFYKATKLDPTDINTRLNLGITFYKTHNKELDALQEFKYVVEQDDTIPDAWHYLGLIFMDMQKKEFALHCFLKAKELGFDDAEKNNELIRDLKFDGIVAMNPLDDDVKDTAFITNKKDVSKR